VTIEQWTTLEERPGYMGSRRAAMATARDQQYGSGNWRLVWSWSGQWLGPEMAYGLYEDAYCLHLQAHPELLRLLLEEASEVYDNAPSNVASGFDYQAQEAGGTHLQDIAIRRVLVRLGVWFRGSQIIQIRDHLGTHSLSMLLSPGQVPFHYPEHITAPELSGWWAPGSVESWYQSSRHVQVRRAS
jgi:hypothetical protein